MENVGTNVTIEKKIKCSFYKKTTFFIWLPISILKQIAQPIMLYFLIICILTCQTFSPKDPLTMITTYLIVVVFGVFKESFEYFSSVKLDRMTNQNYTKTYDYSLLSYVRTIWTEIKVGDLILVGRNETFPADCLLVYTP